MPDNGGRISSEGMDKKISKSRWSARRIVLIIGGAGVGLFFIYSFLFMEGSSSLNVDREKISVSTVERGSFQEFVQVRGNVQPIQTMYLDAIEGGVVEEIHHESGSMVNKGDTILTLSNSDLQLTVMQRTSAIYDQINQTRNSRLNIEQNSLSLNERLADAKSKLEISKSSYERQRELYEQNLIAEQQFLETKEKFKLQQKRYDLIYESFKKDSVKSAQQLQQIDQSLDRMWQSLDAVQHILDRLVVTAPIAGQLSTIELNPGQSISAAERIGQIDILSDYRVRIAMDEYHLSRISTGLNGSTEINNQTYTLQITKIYPVVEDGEFKVDMEFIDAAPDDLRRGQTLRIRLEMSGSSEALLVERGGFYQSSGGGWVYKIADDGQQAIRQPVQLGRQNPHYFEVLSGLEPGDRIITSNYNAFGNNEILNLE